jgi:hypothetical protein
MKCFVIMPFGNLNIDAEQAERLESIYSEWIKPTVESVTIQGTPVQKITCHRADKTARPGEIISHVIENLVDSDIVIADLSGRNSNVFYELGIRHAVNNNTILIADDFEDVPFDLSGLRAIGYKYEPKSLRRLESSLKKAIGEILDEPNKIDNPVRRFLYERGMEIIKIRESEIVKSLLSEVSHLRAELSQQTNAVQQIVKLITAPASSAASPDNKRDSLLKPFEGVWRNEESDFTYYARVVGAELYIPYSYEGRRPLIGYYYNCKAIGETLFARFEWFKREISGYAFLKLKAVDELAGGWWYREDLPPDVLIDVSRINSNLPKMNQYVLTRVKGSTEFPAFVEKYFERIRQRD